MAVIPKENVSAYQRWQFSSFDAPAAPAPEAPPAEVPTVDVPEAAEMPPPADTPPPPPPDFEQLREEAREAGYKAGFDEGRAAGEQAAEENARAVVEDMQQLLGALQQSLAEMDQKVAENLLQLGLEVARQLGRSQIEADDEYLLPIIREAVASLPLHHAHLVIHLHPRDAARVRPHLDGLGGTTQIVEDGTVMPGGCQIRAGTSEIDASVETRWQRILEAIGAPAAAWLKRP